MAVDISLGDTFNIANVDRFRFTITKDKVPWANIDSVTLTFRDEDGLEFDRSAVAENTLLGIWFYDTVVGDITKAGYWLMKVKVVQGTIVKTYPGEIGLQVHNRPGE